MALLAGSVVALSVFVPASAATITPVTADDAGAAALATAMVADSSTLVGARFVEVTELGTPNATTDSLSFFPSDGPSAALLTTGDATLADDDNVSDASGSNNGGLNVRGDTDFDVTVFAVDISVLPTRNCVQFDFAFYSEEFPEYVGTEFNDAFVAELDTTTWTTEGSTISAPDNFAFDAAGDPVTINSTGVTGMNALNSSNTTYDGATVLLQAAHTVTPGQHTLYFSIFDQGDHIYDSAVLLDNLKVLTTDPEDCRPGARQGALPLIVLPGITGSFLFRDWPGGISGEAWPDASEVLVDPDDDSLNQLQLTATGDDPGVPFEIRVWDERGRRGVIDEFAVGCTPVGCVDTRDVYGSMFEYLEDQGYEEGVSLFPLAFDWRKSARFNAELLLAEIDRVLEETDAPRVNILAHSQGGLVTRAALADASSVGKVARILTLGTPYLGTPKALGVLDYAAPCQNEVFGICVLDTARVQQLVTNFPGFLELLPSRAFYGEAHDGPVITFFDRDGDGILDLRLDFPTERAKLADRNLPLIDAAAAFHDDVDTWAPADPDVELTRIVGSGIPTIDYIIEYREEECRGRGYVDCQLVEKSAFYYGTGDKTVPLVSATLRNQAKGFDERGGAPNAFAAGVEHGDLATDEDVLAYAVAYFAAARADGVNPLFAAAVAGGPTGPTPELAAEAEREAAARPGGTATLTGASASGIMDEPTLLSGTEVFVKGSLSGMITDPADNRLGVPDPALEVELSEIPGAAFNSASGGSSSFVTLPNAYAGRWTALADDEVQLVVRDYANDAIGGAASTLPFAVTSGAKVMLSFTSPADLGALAVEVDDDGNGSVDRTVQFGTPVAGASASDLLAPTSQVNVEWFFDPQSAQTTARVTITATDAGGSGIARTDYALDPAGTTGVYTSPLVVPATGRIIVRAIDLAGNVEAPYQVVPLAPTCDGREATIVGTAGADSLNGTAETDVIVGLDGNDDISANAGNDVVCGGDGNDRLVGAGGNDHMLGERGNDVLDGGDAADTLDGGDDADQLLGGKGDDGLVGGQGTDRLDGGADADTLDGREGADVLVGGRHDDVLRGGDADDSLDGGVGDDDLDGGPGTDQLNGGAGTDRCAGGENVTACEVP